MTNSGGGIILFGIDDDGEPSGIDTNPIVNLDPADVTNKIFSYTREHFSDFVITKEVKNQIEIVALQIHGVSVPIVFTNIGSYLGPDGKQKSAFREGTLYFRHGAKSEPCVASDIKEILERYVALRKDFLLDGISQVLEAPEGAKIVVYDTKTSSEVRLSDDPNAPAARLEEKELVELYPFDYHELTNMLRKRYSDFGENNKFYEIKKLLEYDNKYCYIRFLNPRNKKGSMKRLYSMNIVKEFDKHYTLRNS